MVKKGKTNVLEWFNSHTFHHSKFEDIARLVKLKDKQGLKISVGIPTLNEAENIGKTISILKPLMDKHYLIDEIVVVDSGSTDSTEEIARKKGAKVFTAEKHLKDEGVFFHKGENLWKSLHMLKGDIICWVDADIENFHPKWVYGLVGPLLENKKLGYAKAFYERPIKDASGKMQPTGGGRTTEIFSRPMFNVFFPELTGIIQPLSGEYAGRREVLERVPFFIGYGVETGLLIDISKKFGLNSICQVDLDSRIHRNQETKALGRQAFGLLQVYLHRVPELRPFLEEFNAVYRFPEMQQLEDGSKEYFLSEKEIKEVERPPIKGVGEYQLRKSFENDFLSKITSTLWEIRKTIKGKGAGK